MSMTKRFRIKQRFPNFFSGFTPVEAEFDTLEEMTAISFVKRWTEMANFDRFSLSERITKDTYHLMAELSDGGHWVIAFLYGNSEKTGKSAMSVPAHDLEKLLPKWDKTRITMSKKTDTKTKTNKPAKKPAAKRKPKKNTVKAVTHKQLTDSLGITSEEANQAHPYWMTGSSSKVIDPFDNDCGKEPQSIVIETKQPEQPKDFLDEVIEERADKNPAFPQLIEETAAMYRALGKDYVAEAAAKQKATKQTKKPKRSIYSIVGDVIKAIRRNIKGANK